MTMPFAPATSAWTDLLTPSQCPCCGQAVMPSAQDVVDAFTSSMDAWSSSVSQWWGGPGGATVRAVPGAFAGPSVRSPGGGMATPWTGWGRPTPGGTHIHGHQHGHKGSHHRGHGHHPGCGCGCHDHGGHQGCGCGRTHAGKCRQCGTDDCHCQCCVGDDVDLVVYSRLGERRIIPVTLTNERRREREVTLELGGFTTKGGREVPVTGAIVGDSTFTLAPCEERVVIIEVTSAAGESGRQPKQPIDVDDCVVAVAGLRVEGCDLRCPVRIGVVLLPRDCDTFDLVCGCGCC